LTVLSTTGSLTAVCDGRHNLPGCSCSGAAANSARKTICRSYCAFYNGYNLGSTIISQIFGASGLGRGTVHA